MGQGYFSHQNIASADDCCPCECNCDIFSELFKSRTGAADPANIEFDLTNKRVWTKTGIINLSATSPKAAVFVGNATLKCETPPLRSDDFCVGIVGTFTDPQLGQQVVIKFGSIEAKITLVRYDPGIFYVFKGELPDSLLELEFRCSVPSFLAAMFIKDGRLSLLANGTTPSFNFPNWGNNSIGDGWIMTGTGDPAFTPFDADMPVPTSGITSETIYFPTENFVEIETRSMVADLRLTTFMLHNHQSEIKYRCQEFFLGSQWQCTDLSPAQRYRIDVHNLFGIDHTDWSIELGPLVSRNSLGAVFFGLPGIGDISSGWTNNVSAYGTYQFNPSNLLGVAISFVGSSANNSYFSNNNGPGCMVEFSGPGGTPTWFLHHHTKPPYEMRQARWYGAARSMNAVRLYGGQVDPFGFWPYDPTADKWVDVTAL